MLAVTPRGRSALREWLESGVDLDVAASVHDALRTRIFFLDLLRPAAQLDFVRSALRACEEHAAAIESDVEARESSGDRFGLLGARGAWHTSRARLAWLREIEAELTGDTD